MAGRGAGGGGRLALELVLLLALLGVGAVLCAPWNQDEDLSALGSLDSLLALEDLQQAVQQAEAEAWASRPGGGAGGTGSAKQSNKVAVTPWQPAEPDPQVYLLTEYQRGDRTQTRVKRNREPAPSGPAAARGGAASGLRRHVRNPPGGSGQRLSIVNPLDVLRQRLLLEIARRRKASVPQSNREMLEGIGKRAWNPSTVTMSIEQQLERCLAQLSDTLKNQDKLTRLAILYHAIDYGKCDITSDLADQTEQQQQHLSSSDARPQEQEREDQEEWSARRQASGWSRNARADTTSNLTS